MIESPDATVVSSSHLLQKYFLTAISIIDACYTEEQSPEAKRAIASTANSFFLGLSPKPKIGYSQATNLLILTLINHKFDNFRLFYPTTLIQEKLKWKLSNEALQNAVFPSQNNESITEGLLHMLFVKTAFIDKTTRNRLNSSVFEPIVALGNQIYTTRQLRLVQFEYVRACITILLCGERQNETILDSKTEGFVQMAGMTLVRSYLNNPEVYFERMLSLIEQVSQLVRKSFAKEPIRQLYYKFSVIFFRNYAESLLEERPNPQSQGRIRELEAMCQTVLKHLNQLYAFDMFFDNEELFLRSSLRRFAGELVFQALEEYNLMISLPSVEAGPLDGGEIELSKRRSVLFREDNRFQLLTYLSYLQMLSVSRRSIDLNLYLQNEFGRNFKLRFLAQYVRNHDLENGAVYFKVT